MQIIHSIYLSNAVTVESMQDNETANVCICVNNDAIRLYGMQKMRESHG